MTMLATLPNFFAYVATCVALLAAFLALYTLVLPGDEWGQIRQGNVAAAIVLGASMLGFSLPMASAVIHSSGLADMVVWAGIALVLQLACVAAMRLLRRGASHSIVDGNAAEATLHAAAALSLGLLNAACLS